MHRLFYFNLTYACNNQCRDCISQNVILKNSKFISVTDLESIVEEFMITANDYWLFSGGEPTLSPYFSDIINYSFDKSPHIHLYTNGRKLKDISFEIIKKIERILIPLYGPKSVHNDYVQSNIAYTETLLSIQNILKETTNKLEIKLMLDGKGSISNLLHSVDGNIILKNNNFSVTRVIKNDMEDIPSSITDEASEIITYLLSLGKIVRFYDIPFCKLSKRLQYEIRTKLIEGFNFDSNVICGNKNQRYVKFSFNKASDYFSQCPTCSDSMLCCKIMQNIFCPAVSRDKVLILTE